VARGPAIVANNSQNDAVTSLYTQPFWRKMGDIGPTKQIWSAVLVHGHLRSARYGQLIELYVGGVPDVFVFKELQSERPQTQLVSLASSAFMLSNSGH